MSAPKRIDGWFDFALYALMWLLLLAGIIGKDVWLFAPAAFFILLEHLEER